VARKQKGASANREGRPWKRPDGRWAARVWPPKGSLERKPRYVYGRNRNEVIAKRRDLEVRLGRGLPSDPDQTVGDYFHRWLTVTLPQYVAAGEMAESTMDSYRDNARKHIVPEGDGPSLEHIKLTGLSAPVVREWQKQLGQKPSGRARRTLREGETELPPADVLSVRTVAYCRAILHKAIEDALRDETAGLERNVVSLVKPPKKRQAKARTVVPPEQVGRLLVAMSDDRLWCYWFLAFALGFRRGEGLGMEWEDIDFARQTWKPKHTVQRLRGDADPATGHRKGRLVSKELKTEASIQAVALPRRAVEALQRWEREQRKMIMRAPYWADRDLVFSTRTGSALEPRGINRAWERLCEKAGVPVVKLHDLRHACASYLLNAGADLKTVQGYLRHAQGSTTQLYLHALEEIPRSGADAMDTILGNLFALAESSGS
jgi:integrase